MQVWKKFSAIALALVMSLALCAPAFAASNDPAELETGTNANSDTVTGQAGTFLSADTPISQNKTLNLKKEITAYNVDGLAVKAPTISYTYTIDSVTVAANTTTVSDKADKHSPAQSVNVPVYTGEGTPTIANSGVVSWTSTDTVELNTGTDGVANYKDISIDFSSVVFSKPGVYRYKITEALPAYSASGVTETRKTDTTTADLPSLHERYVDVYVRAAETGYTDGLTAAQWDIYGYTCFYKNQSITEDNKATGAVKTIGFVAGTTDGNPEHQIFADSYYTYNVAVSKTVDKDNYAKVNHFFPFTVIFTNSNITQNVAIKTTVTQVNSSDTAASATDFAGGDTNLISGTFTDTNDFMGVLKIKHNTVVKYIGIPCGTNAEIYETNDVDGVTYYVETVVNNNTTNKTSDTVISTTTAASTTPQANPKATHQSTKATITSERDVDDDIVHTIAIKNTLVNISPTGVTLRYAPYLAMMGAGIVALPLSLRKKEEEI